MASVREELIEQLVEEYECSYSEAKAAVDKAIKAWEETDEPDGWSDKLEHIYRTQEYWE